ncbi:hypothetical protein AQUCO_00700342v1 [Aquilegia coerulea]|nr:hypothetical protein AQUCO_00700342v1 [Aquilegia coerulea]
MEIVEKKALKTKMNMKLTQEPVCEDVWVDNVIPSDDFFVDDLLDFSKEEVFNQGDEDEEEEEEKDFLSVSEDTQNENDNENNSNGVSVKQEFGSVPGSELSVPADDVEQLEWLSHFVEDSFTEYSLPYPEENPLGKILNPKPKTLLEPETMLKESEIETSTTPFLAKGRSKRIKRKVQHFPHQLWSLGSSETSNSTFSGSGSGSTSSASSGSSLSCLIFNNTTPNHELLYFYDDEQPAKKNKKGVSSSEINGAQIQRRCSHCGVQKTPQWRAGPLGPKTLCNACGVRFKSGRLYPEYRPACSPTFSSEVHSNSHRKVLEMRRKKESGLAPPVQSF